MTPAPRVLIQTDELAVRTMFTQELGPSACFFIAEMPVSGNDSLAAQEAAYRRCALTGKPSYEYARIHLGDGYRETFEWLLLPFSSDGSVVDHIVGAVVIDREAVGE